MKHIFSLSALLLFAGNGIAVAQPPMDNGPKAPNPANLDGGIDFQKQFTEIMRMTPQQRAEMMRKTQEQTLRASFTRAGFKDLKLQDAVIAFVAQQEQSREAVRKSAAKVYLSLSPRPGAEAPDMKPLLDEYLSALADVKSERELSVKALDKEIGFSTDTKLTAFLTLNGIIGDAPFYTGDSMMMGTMGFAGVAPLLVKVVGAPR